MTKEEILAAAGFPNTPEGIAAFYEAYPDQGAWQQQMAFGGIPHAQSGYTLTPQQVEAADQAFGRLQHYEIRGQDDENANAAYTAQIDSLYRNPKYDIAAKVDSLNKVYPNVNYNFEDVPFSKLYEANKKYKDNKDVIYKKQNLSGASPAYMQKNEPEEYKKFENQPNPYYNPNYKQVGGSPFIQGFPFGAGITMAYGGTPLYKAVYGITDPPVKTPMTSIPGWDPSTGRHMKSSRTQPNLTAAQLEASKYTQDAASGNWSSPGSIYGYKELYPGDQGWVDPNPVQTNSVKSNPLIRKGNYSKDTNYNTSTADSIKYIDSGNTTTIPQVLKRHGGAPCYECGGHMEDGGIFGYGQFPAVQGGGDPNLLWAQQEQLAAQNRAGYNVPGDAKATGTNPLFYNPYLEGSDIAETDSMHTSPYNENIRMYFKNGKPIIGPANESGAARKAAADLNRGAMFKGKDNRVYPNYLAKQRGGAFDQSNNQNYPMLDAGGYGWVKDAIAGVNSRKAGGDLTEQGGNQDFLTQRNEYVRNYMQKMVDMNIRQEEAQDVENAFIQMDSQMPPVGAPPMAYGGYMQNGGGPGVYYNGPYDEVNSRNEAVGMAAENQYNTLQNNTKQAWGNLIGSFGANSFDPNNFYAQDGKIVQNKDESWDDYQERIREDKAGREGGSGRIWDGTRWVKSPTTATQQTNPWTNLAEAGNPEGNYSNWIPDNDIRTGYRFGKKDFKELSKLDPNTQKLSGIKLNYGPMGRVLPRVFGPKSVTLGTVDMSKGAFEGYNPSGQNQNVQNQNVSQSQDEKSHDDMNWAGRVQDNWQTRKAVRQEEKRKNEIAKIGPEQYKENQAWDNMSWAEKRASKKFTKGALREDKDMFKRMEENKKNQGEIIKPDYGPVPAGTMIDNSGDHSKSVKPSDKSGFYKGRTMQEAMDSGENYYENYKAYGGLFRAQPGASTPVSYDEWEESLRFTPPAIDDSGDEMPPSLITGNEKEQTEEEALADVAGIQKRRAEQNDMFGPPMNDKPDIMGAPGKSYTAKKKTTGVGRAAVKRSALIADTISSGVEQRRSTAKQRMKESQYGMNRFKVKPANAIDEGDYDLNSGMFRPDQDVPVQFAGYAQWGGFNTMANGGNMSPGLYGTNGNNQFTHNAHLESGKISQKDIDTRQTLGPVPRHLANLEAEKGETAIVNMGGIPAHFKIGGKRHSQGGTPLNLPDNSFIFSDTAKMKIKDPIILAQFGMVVKSGGYTPAEIAKKYDINKFRKILAEPNSENLERKTAEMMIANYNLKLAKLAMLQESKKGFPQGIPVVAMPYILENEIDPATFLPDQAQEQLEEGAQPDAEMGVARYGANVVSQWDTHRYGGLPFAQEGGGFWSSVGHGLLNVLEAPQKAMMYAGTGMFGDREFEMQKMNKSGKPTGEFEWVSEDNVPAYEKANALGVSWRKTGQSEKAHYEMPGETLKRTYPDSSPILQGALDIVADPFLVSGIGKSLLRGAVKKITNSAANHAVKGTLKNTTKYETTRLILKEAGKEVTARNLAIASKALKASEKAIVLAENAKKTVDAAKVSKIARKAGVAGMKEHDIQKVGEFAVDVVGKPVVNAAKAAAKATGKAVKYATDKAVDLVKNIDPGPLAGPLVASGARNVATLGLKEDVAKSKAENIRLKEELKATKDSRTQYKPLRTEGKIGVFYNPSKPGKEFMFQNGEYVPYVPQAKKDSVLVEKAKLVEIPKGKKDSTKVDYNSMSLEELEKLLKEN